MFGLDDLITSYSDGAAAWIVVLVAVLLGLRHATDPDHIAAVTTLVAGTRERATRTAAALGAAWGLGHATTLFAFGVPILVLDRFLPERVQQLAESAIAVAIGYLAVRLIIRWRRGLFHRPPSRTRRCPARPSSLACRGHRARPSTSRPDEAGLIRNRPRTRNGRQRGRRDPARRVDRVAAARSDLPGRAGDLHRRIDDRPVDGLRRGARQPAAPIVARRPWRLVSESRASPSRSGTEPPPGRSPPTRSEPTS